jgi:hypothetical protein
LEKSEFLTKAASGKLETETVEIENELNRVYHTTSASLLLSESENPKVGQIPVRCI